MALDPLTSEWCVSAVKDGAGSARGDRGPCASDGAWTGAVEPGCAALSEGPEVRSPPPITPRLSSADDAVNVGPPFASGSADGDTSAEVPGLPVSDVGYEPRSRGGDFRGSAALPAADVGWELWDWDATGAGGPDEAPAGCPALVPDTGGLVVAFACADDTVVAASTGGRAGDVGRAFQPWYPSYPSMEN